MTTRIAKTVDGIIEYSIYGNGIPILFIHGGHVSCNFILPHKGIDIKKFQLITPSRPGYGNTPMNNNGSPYPTAKLLVSLLDSLNISKVIVYGISAGGWTALELAGNFPNRVSKLILGSAVTKDWLDKNGGIYKGAKKIFSPKIEWLTWGMIKLMCSFTPNLIAKAFFPSFSTRAEILPKNDISELMNSLRLFRSKRGFVSDIDQTVKVETLRKIVCPTLILHSKNDNSVPLEHAQHAKEEIRNSELLIFNNLWGHMIWIGAEYKIILDSIEKFINE